LVATVIYAMPPAARLTYLGIQQVPNETLEAAIAFGSTRRQLFQKVRFPMALPSIMAGVNQTIMMALSMVVICALIGADGLGREVLFALRRLRVGMAMEAGLAIVSMAILLDRLELRGAGNAKRSVSPISRAPGPRCNDRSDRASPRSVTRICCTAFLCPQPCLRSPA
jgi:ABC-type proline/glycine betaine transport system permease subunit